MKKIVSYVFIFLFISSIFTFFTYNIIENRVKIYLKTDIELSQVTFNTIIEAYRVHSNIIYFNAIDTNEIKSLLQNINTLSENELSIVRTKLHDKLIDMYKNMQSYKLKQLHFHLKNNDSFLRFHRPNKFGDSLTGIRSTVEYVNKFQKPIHGFEEGRIFNGYRFVYPLVYNKKYLGSVETSISMNAIIQEFKKGVSENVDFILKKEIVDKKIFSSEKSNYKSCETAKDYYHEKTISNGKNELIEAIIRKYNISNDINKDLANNVVFNIPSSYKGSDYIVTFLPILNVIKNETVGYIIVLKEHKALEDFKQQYILFLAILIMLFASIIYFVYRIDKNKTILKLYQTKVEKAKSQFESLVFNIPDMVYRCEVDEECTMLYLNNSTHTITGYTENELKHNNLKSFASIIHPDDKKFVLNEIKRIIANDISSLHLEYRIISKGNKIVWITDYIRIIKENDYIYIEGIISDITAQKVAYSKLYKFIDTQDNIVILTDGIKINFANKKFCDFLAYDNLEHFKEEFDCICEKFVENDRFFHLGKIKSDENWIDVMVALPQSKRIVALLGQNLTLHVFSVTFNTFEDDLHIISFSDITETMSVHHELEDKSIHDKLTNAFNREFFEKNYQSLILKYKKDNCLFALVMIDIDHFKKVNDTYGHDVGDYVLIELVSEIKKSSREEDLLIRWGGEEFIMILKVKNEKKLLKVLVHIRTIIEKHYFNVVKQITCSFGASIYLENEDIKETIKRADVALYEAKDLGRNKVIIH